MLQTFGVDPSIPSPKDLSPAFSRCLESAAIAAKSSEEILVFGESGSGKGWLARRIHEMSGRKGRFVVWSAPEGSDSLGLSELFGHVRGAFTGAERDFGGLLEEAKAGTLLVDDVDKLSLKLQRAILRLLDDHTYRKYGSSSVVPFDA